MYQKKTKKLYTLNKVVSKSMNILREREREWEREREREQTIPGEILANPGDLEKSIKTARIPAETGELAEQAWLLQFHFILHDSTVPPSHI